MTIPRESSLGTIFWGGFWVLLDYDAHSIFRTWHNRLKDQSEELLQTIVIKDTTEETNSIIQEVQVYLKDSFGNSTRIDYGTGKETIKELRILRLFQFLLEMGLLGRPRIMRKFC